MHSKIEYHLELPDDFDEYFWGSKGYFPNAKLTIDRKTFIVTFYEPIRFQQDIVEEIKSDSFFFQNNIIIVKGRRSRYRL